MKQKDITSGKTTLQHRSFIPVRYLRVDQLGMPSGNNNPVQAAPVVSPPLFGSVSIQFCKHSEVSLEKGTHDYKVFTEEKVLKLLCNGQPISALLDTGAKIAVKSKVCYA